MPPSSGRSAGPAAGAGVVPWIHNYDRLEENWLAPMLMQPGRTVSLAAAKIVARQVRKAFWERHWGTTWPLRRVERLPSSEGFRVGLWSADWTPWPVLAACRARWPALRFALRIVFSAS